MNRGGGGGKPRARPKWGQNGDNNFFFGYFFVGRGNREAKQMGDAPSPLVASLDAMHVSQESDISI